VIRHDRPADVYRDHARLQRCGQQCLHRRHAADQSLPPGMPSLAALEIDAIATHSSQSPATRANKPSSTRRHRPSPDRDRHRALATIPIVSTSRGFVQSGFYEVALTLVFRARSCHATSQNPQDSRNERGTIQDGKLRGFAVGQAIPVLTDYTAGEVRRFAQRAKDAAQARRLLAICGHARRRLASYCHSLSSALRI